MVDRHAVAIADGPCRREDDVIGAVGDLEVADRLADDRRIGHALELDQVEIAGVVEDHAGRAAASDRLDVALDVDQGRLVRSGRNVELKASSGSA